MKTSHYDTLQVSTRASTEIIDAAYQRLKPSLTEAARNGDFEARNQLLFLEEAYSVLASPEKRAAYDAAQAPASAQAPAYQRTYAYEAASSAPSGMFASGTARLVLSLGLCVAVFSAYKFIGQSGQQKNQANQIEASAQRGAGEVRNDAYRAENERMLVQGTVHNQGKQIDNSYNIADREAERRQRELDYRANADAQVLDMQRRRLEAQQQQQQWQQEQYEKDRKLREAKIAADAPKKQLCNMYALSGNTRDARAAGCYY